MYWPPFSNSHLAIAAGWSQGNAGTLDMGRRDQFGRPGDLRRNKPLMGGCGTAALCLSSRRSAIMRMIPPGYCTDPGLGRRADPDRASVTLDVVERSFNTFAHLLGEGISVTVTQGGAGDGLAAWADGGACAPPTTNPRNGSRSVRCVRPVPTGGLVRCRDGPLSVRVLRPRAGRRRPRAGVRPRRGTRGARARRRRGGRTVDVR